MTTSDRDRDGEDRRDSTTTFGEYGGRYVPEALMPAILELEDAYERYVLANEDGFMDEFRERMCEFGGRPTPLQRAGRLSDRYDREIYLKREDLVHGGAHKLNNALGQVLLAKYMGKERIIAETGAGQHGTATAMAAAHLDVPCEIYMGRTDVNRQRPNVYRMRMNGAEVNPVTAGSGTLKEAINETMRDWATTVETTHYVIGSVVGPIRSRRWFGTSRPLSDRRPANRSASKRGNFPTASSPVPAAGRTRWGVLRLRAGQRGATVRADSSSAERSSADSQARSRETTASKPNRESTSTSSPSRPAARVSRSTRRWVSRPTPRRFRPGPTACFTAR